MVIQEILAKSCLSESKLTDYVINPYVGCQHACCYCYAVFMKRFHRIEEPWGEFVHVKINCAELLEGELKRAKPGNIWLSSVTDPYLPLESKFKITRQILEVLASSSRKDGFPIEVLTKSALLTRDLDLLTKLSATVGCSINTLDPQAARRIEPNAATPQKRIEVLKTAQKRGLTVYGFISPVLPGITRLEEIFAELSFCDHVWVELLNTKTSVMGRLVPVLNAYYPDSEAYINKFIQNPEAFYQKVVKKVSDLSVRYSLKVRKVVRHDN